ncbi:hypothetical protein [Nocardiopsis dassonvillei]|uniref:hypothetical protein n=1 Tax=Nocardiopsis dassonvillei TaxID=2014 RepID=UPI003630F4B7
MTAYDPAEDEVPDPRRDPEGFADYLFDAVSGNLRERPNAGAWAAPPSRATKAQLRAALVTADEDYKALRRNLVETDAAFDQLHEWLMAGRPLPDPWRKHFRPVDDVQDQDKPDA